MTFTRPFRNAHILLPIALFIGAEFLLIRDPCGARPVAAYTAFATAVVCVAGWLAHLRVGPLHDWRVALRLMYEALGDLLKFGRAVLFASLLICLPMAASFCLVPRLALCWWRSQPPGRMGWCGGAWERQKNTCPPLAASSQPGYRSSQQTASG